MDSLDPIEWGHKLGKKLVGCKDKEVSGRINKERVAHCGVVYADGELYISNNKACHAGLTRYWRDTIPKTPVCIVSHNQEMEKAPESYKLLYLDWLLNRSPYQDGFHSKSASECLSQGYVISRVDKPSNLVVAGLVAQRRMWEYSYVMKSWVDLVAAGVGEDLAYLYAHTITHSSGGEVRISEGLSCHVSLSVGSMSNADYYNFLTHKPVELTGLYVDGANYRRMDALYGNSHHKKVSLGGEVLKHYTNEEEVKGPNINPFPSPYAKKGESYTYKGVIKAFAKYSKEHMKEIGA